MVLRSRIFSWPFSLPAHRAWGFPAFCVAKRDAAPCPHTVYPNTADDPSRGLYPHAFLIHHFTILSSNSAGSRSNVFPTVGALFAYC